jgi:hypothetical protein
LRGGLVAGIGEVNLSRSCTGLRLVENILNGIAEGPNFLGALEGDNGLSVLVDDGERI